MDLYLIRHAESQFNREGRVQGQLDPPLSPLGERQAQVLAQAVAGLQPEVVVSSPLRRAYDTARPLVQVSQAELIIVEELKELHAGVFQGRLWSELEREFPEAVAQWRSGNPDVAIPGGESRRQLMRRSWQALQKIHQLPHQVVVVVAHGGVIAAGLKALLGIPPQRNPFRLHNASMIQVHWPSEDPHGEKAKLLFLNRIDHLVQAGCPTESLEL